jgi:hypothetical protein
MRTRRVCAVVDYREGIKKDVAEIKFLIHDLRVERFINEVIHYHVTVNTDLEIYNVEQAQVLHGEDLQELKAQAVLLRKATQDYSNAVKNFSPDKTVLATGQRYVETVDRICQLILNPLWGRIDRVISFLPKDSHAYQSRSHYRNCIRWISGVDYRIKGFLADEDEKLIERFDVAAELSDFTRNVVRGYVAEKSHGRVELRLEASEPAVLEGNPHRFRRMYFNLVMNAVDAMTGKRVGMLRIRETLDGDRVLLEVQDNGSGIPAEKIRVLLTDKETLDGELHSLGFVFVRQTIAEMGGELSIASRVDEGTTITVRLPRLADEELPPKRPSPWDRFNRLWGDDGLPPLEESSGPPSQALPRPPAPTPASVGAPGRRYGDLLLADYANCEAEHPGCVFAIAVAEDDRVELFTHRPYERYWNITHEDLSPVYYQASVRGRVEEDEEKKMVLILKAPLSLAEFFELKNVPEANRSADRYVRMMHGEYVRIARTLLSTGMPGETGVFMTDAERFFADRPELYQTEPVALSLLARQEIVGRVVGS